MNQQNTTLVITGAAHGLVHLLMLALPYITTKLLLVTPILPGSEWLVVLLLNTPAYFVFGFGAIPAGFLCDRIGPRKVIALGLMLSVFSGIALFFLWPLGIGVIAFLFMTYAFGAGLYHPAGTTWVSNTFDKNRGKALGRHGIGGSIGQMMAPLISALILSTIFWPVIFLFLAAIGIVIAFVTLRVRVQVYDVKIPPNSKLKQGKGFFSVVTPAVMLVVSVILVARGMLYRGTVTALPVYITLELGALLVIAGFIGTLVYVGGIFGQEIGGRLSDRYGWRRILTGMTLLSGGALLLLAIPYVPIIWGDLLLIAAVMLFGFSFFAAQAATNTMVANLSNPESRGQVFGWSFFTRFGLGAFGIPIVTFSFFIFGTWVAGFFLLALLSVLAAFLVIFVHQRQQT
ncbi:MFS transporter [Candidatus Bathyarchaeota archaeon]|nr:MFS transporter [Candidatus Bathyarchaeota archaeon]